VLVRRILRFLTNTTPSAPSVVASRYFLDVTSSPARLHCFPSSPRTPPGCAWTGTCNPPGVAALRSTRGYCPASPSGWAFARQRRARRVAWGERAISEPPQVIGSPKSAPR
jgi:hypothetical protein